MVKDAFGVCMNSNTMAVLTLIFLRDICVVRSAIKRILETQNFLLRLFVPKTAKVTEMWRRLPNEGIYGVYPSLNIIRMINQGE